VTLRALADRVLSLLLAPPCAICGDVLTRPLSGAVCETCWRALEIAPSRFYLPVISTATSLGIYESSLRDLIHALKYDARRSIAPRLSDLMATHASDVLRGADIVVPVPLHRRRRRQRGFNQAEDLARGLGLPVARAVARVRATQPQVDLPASARRANVREAFALAPWWRQPALERRVIVLVDDVATTGATLEACARVLTRAGAAEVRALTAARAVSGLPSAPRASRRPSAGFRRG
jgi:ComF family protein